MLYILYLMCTNHTESGLRLMGLNDRSQKRTNNWFDDWMSDNGNYIANAAQSAGTADRLSLGLGQ